MKIVFLILILTINTQAQVLSEKTEIDLIEVTSFGPCQIRQSTKIFRGGIELSRTFHRWAIDPDGDLSKFDERVKSVCKAGWTPEVVKKFKDNQKKNFIQLGGR